MTLEVSDLFTYPLLTLSPDVPSDTEAFSARKQLKIAEEALHKLDFKISLLLARRQQIISRIDRCKNVIAPYKKLPAELLARIILLCVPKV